MKKLLIIFLFNFIFIFPLLAQSQFDYLLINQLIYSDRDNLTEDSIYFLTTPALRSREFGGNRRTHKELIEWYYSSTERLLKDTLPQYSNIISKKVIKKSFVKWNRNKINHKFITKNKNSKFVYLTKPIKVDDNLYIITEVDYSGITIILYSYDKNIIHKIKSRTIRRVDIWFRT